ncbi:MAG: class II aldolase/adducin family protein [Terracidiphilus sp.]
MDFDAVRNEVLQACLHLADKGYLAGTGGNVACRAGAEHLAITPSASDYYAMTPDDICIVHLSDLKCVAGQRPSVELRLHAFLQGKHDAHATIHTHQPIASAYSLLGEDLTIRNPEWQKLLGEKALCVGYAPSGTNWLAGKLKKRLNAGVNAYLMRNHGIICCGRTMANAIERVEALEAECSDFFRTVIEERAAAERGPAFLQVLSLLIDSNLLESTP